MKNGKLSNEIFKQCDLMLGAFGGESNTRDRSDYATIIKVFDAVANKCPILTKENCATHEIFGESLYYSNSTVEDITEKIKIIINSDEKTINKKVDVAYSYYVDNASELIFKNKLSDLFKI